MAVPYAAAGKSLKKKMAKSKPPVSAKKMVTMSKGKSMFTPPGMDAEDKIDGGVDEKMEKN